MVSIELKCPQCDMDVKELTVRIDGGNGIKEILKGAWYCSGCESLYGTSMNKIMTVPKTFVKNNPKNSTFMERYGKQLGDPTQTGG